MGHTYDDDDDADDASFFEPYHFFLLELLWHDGYSLGVDTSLTLIPTMTSPLQSFAASPLIRPIDIPTFPSL